MSEYPGNIMSVAVQSPDQGHQSLQDTINFSQHKLEVNPPPSKLQVDIPSDQEFQKYIQTIEQDLDSKNFKILPRDIHSEEAIRFNVEVLQAPPEVIKILREGYTPRYTERPEPVCLLNNASALKKMDFCVSQVINCYSANLFIFSTLFVKFFIIV